MASGNGKASDMERQTERQNGKANSMLSGDHAWSLWMVCAQLGQQQYLDRQLQDALVFVHHKLAAGLPDAAMPAQPQCKLKAVSALQHHSRDTLQICSVDVALVKDQSIITHAKSKSQQGLMWSGFQVGSSVRYAQKAHDRCHISLIATTTSSVPESLVTCQSVTL